MFKLFALLLVLGVAAQGAPTNEARDFRIVITEGIKIARIVGDAILQGIKDATPSIQTIEGEMNADLAANVHGLLTRIQTDVETVIDRVKDLESTVQTAISDLDAAAGDCQDAVEASLKPILNNYGGELAALINQIAADNREELDSVYAGAKELGDTIHSANIDGVNGGVKCVQGKKDVKACLDANGVVFTTTLTGALADGVLLLNEALPLVNTTLTSLVSGLQPGFNETRNAADEVFATYGSCVEGS